MALYYHIYPLESHNHSISILAYLALNNKMPRLLGTISTASDNAFSYNLDARCFLRSQRTACFHRMILTALRNDSPAGPVRRVSETQSRNSVGVLSDPAPRLPRVRPGENDKRGKGPAPGLAQKPAIRVHIIVLVTSMIAHQSNPLRGKATRQPRKKLRPSGQGSTSEAAVCPPARRSSSRSIII